MASEPSAETGSGWRVTDQMEVNQPNAQGRFVPGVKVGFITANGVMGSVFLENAVYSPENVKKAIAAKAAVLDSVSNLKG